VSLYVVVNCPRCGGLMLAKTVHRTRSCPRCGYRAELRGLRVLGRTDSSTEAVALIQALKEKRVGKRG
jgi:DNA-directed RNA polymerase subunit M/transcription elongation factor TFIIS